MTELIELRYGGQKIRAQDGMDAEEVIQAIDGFGDFLRSLTQATAGEGHQPRLSIRGFRRGSFEIQFLYEVAAAAQTALNALGAVSIGDAIKQAFELLKHLNGQNPKSIKRADHGSVYVENNNGKIIVINQPIVNAVVNGDASQSAEQFVRGPLKEEAETIEVSVNGKVAAEVNREGAESFTPIGASETLGEYSSQQHLTIQTLVLEGDGLWRFSDGRNKFRAEIEDKAFMERVKAGKERFGRGDILKVRLKSKQERIRGQLKTTHICTERVIG